MLDPGSPAPETVLAGWEGAAITLAELERHRAGKAGGRAGEPPVSEAALLELLVRRRMLAQAAGEAGVEATAAYGDVYRRIREDEANAWMTDRDVRFRALAEAYLQREVIDRLEIEEADLREMFALYRPSMPAEMTYEGARDQLVNLLRRQAVERFVRGNIDTRRVSFNDEWLEKIALTGGDG